VKANLGRHRLVLDDDALMDCLEVLLRKRVFAGELPVERRRRNVGKVRVHVVDEGEEGPA
jgi:hypothetical protein